MSSPLTCNPVPLHYYRNFLASVCPKLYLTTFPAVCFSPWLFLLFKNALSLIPSIGCNHECIQITTFPCADHMFVLQTEVALSH